VRARSTRKVTLLLLVAAGAAGTAVAQGRPAQHTAVPKALVGCWSRHVPALPVGTSAGTWLIRIGANGSFAAYTPGSAKCGSASDFTSHVAVRAGRMTIGHVPICATNGTYAVTTGHGTLTLKKVSDASCAARAKLLAGTWRRKA
jgi:hypothetical protein